MTDVSASIVVLDDAAKVLGLKQVRAPFSRDWDTSHASTKETACLVVSSTAAFVRDFPAGPVKPLHDRLLLLSHIAPSTLDYVERVFQSVVVADPDPGLADILRAENRDELFVAASYDPIGERVILHRGSLETLAIPLSWFASTATGVMPDPIVRIIDHGQTVALGEYQASADAILYEFDSAYRARAKKRAINVDKSFGGSFRRLRLQRGFARAAFEPAVSAKTIARIERNEVHPRGATLATLAKKLQVKPTEVVLF
jgi:hypothetical protein